MSVAPLGALALIASAIAAEIDHRTLRLPNAFILDLLVVAFSAQVAAGRGVEAFVVSAACLVAAVTLGARVGGIGGADGKLLAGLGACLGWPGLALAPLAMALQPPSLFRPLAPTIARATALVVLVEIVTR